MRQFQIKYHNRSYRASSMFDQAIVLVEETYVLSKNIPGSLKKRYLPGIPFIQESMSHISNQIKNIWKIHFGVVKL